MRKAVTFMIEQSYLAYIKLQCMVRDDTESIKYHRLLPLSQYAFFELARLAFLPPSHRS